MHASLLLALTLVAQVDAPSTEPAIAVLGMDGRQGVSRDLAVLLTEKLATRLRSRGAFSRVVSSTDVEAALGFEAQRQLLDCNSSSCMAEIAGALGVDYLFVSSAGQVEDVWVFNARIIHTRSGSARGALSKTLTGGQSVLVKEADGVVDEVLQEAGLLKGPPPDVAATPPAPPSSTEASVSFKAESPSVLPVVLRGVSAVSAVVGVAAGLLVLGGLATSGGAVGTARFMPGADLLEPALQGAFVAGLGVAGLFAVVVPLAALVAVATVAASFI
ncbi:MAG: hypothetical protein AB2A00_06355 [Myxococcota bacterium]